MPQVMKIMDDVFFASHNWIIGNPGRAVRQGVTHVIIPAKLVTQGLRD